jgi:hypothetical protein
MPRIGFVCPDKTPVTFAECFKACRMGERCAPLPYLKGLAIQRKLTGHTVTELTEPTRHMWLKKTRDYYESPDVIDFAFRGSSHHFVLDRNASGDVLTEERDRLDLGDGRTITGAFDYYDPETRSLEDYKFWGAYRVRKALNAATGQGALSFSLCGGQPVYDDLLPVVFQQNCYRMILERAGFPVDSMALWLYVRDYNAQTARQYKLDRKWYRALIRREDDEVVLRYARHRYERLEQATLTGTALRCSEAETWQGKRCDGWCPVRAACDALDMKGGNSNGQLEKTRTRNS